MSLTVLCSSRAGITTLTDVVPFAVSKSPAGHWSARLLHRTSYAEYAARTPVDDLD